MNDIRPRKRAAEILLLPEAERAQAIAAIEGDALRSTVKFYVDDHEQRLKHLVAWVLAGETLTLRRLRINSVPASMQEEVKRRVTERYSARRESCLKNHSEQQGKSYG